MEELLQKLLEAEVLTDETKSELQEAFKMQLDEAVAAAKKAAAADVRTELTEQWIEERDALVEAVDSKVTEFMESELEELKDDIERFRDLEAEYAEKIVEAKQEMAHRLNHDIAELVEKLDTFLELRLAAELEELQEDLQEARQNEFGRRIFEAFADEFMMSYSDDESAEMTLRETEERLASTVEALEETESRLLSLERKIKMEEVLSPLSGRQREVMEAILRNVETEDLEEGYKTFVGRVLRETARETEVDEATNSEKENTVLAEGEKHSDTVNRRLVTGDTVVTESKDMDAEARRAYLQRLAGIK